MIQTSRTVALRTIIEVIRNRPRALTTGLIFSSVGLFSLIAMTIIFSEMASNGPDVDYDELNLKGVNTTGTITDIETQYNTSINNKHPSIISYRYTADGRELESTFTTLDPDRVSLMHPGDSVPVKHWNGASVITNLKPFQFPYWIIYAIEGVFLCIGLSLLVWLAIKTRKEIQLYKLGYISEAKVISMNSQTARSMGGQRLNVHYQYSSKYNPDNTFLGNSLSRDVSLLATFRQGDLIKIFVMPDDESISTMVPKLEVVRNNWKLH
jgi:hypothetical protein